MAVKKKVGIVIGPHANKWVETYNDTVGMSPKRPWLDAVPRSRRVDEDGRFKPTGRFVRIDIAMAYALMYINEKRGQPYALHIIPAGKVSSKLFEGYDFIFYHWFDLLIVPSYKPFADKAGRPMAKLKKIYDKHAPKIFPPAKYADLIYDKCDYYSFLSERGLPVGNTVCVNRHEFEAAPKATASRIARHIKLAKWGEAFAKPVWGTDAIDVGRPAQLNTQPKILKYLTQTFANQRYPKVVFQKFYSDFETTVPQIRTYWLGDRYQYSVMEDHTEHYLTEANDVPLIEKAKAIARETFKYIKPLFRKDGRKVDPFVTRVDFGCCLEKGNKDTLFINEIEFNPGLYLYMDPVDSYRRMNFDFKMATQADRIIRQFFGFKQPRGKIKI